MAISEKLKTSFQKNMEQTINNNWYKGDIPTGREVIGRIGQISKNDPQRANNLYGQYKQMQSDATSPFYNPYTKPTNAAVSNLAAMGVDVSNIDDDWYQKNSWLKNYYTFSGTTNTPSKPGKKASAEEKAAYEYYQLYKSEEATKKVEQQWKALQEELTYWAGRKDRNYSDDEIIGKIDWSNYKALTDLENAAKAGAPTELNRATDFSRDNMYAVIWAARNNGGTGSMEGDLIASAMGAGNQWQLDPVIADKLNPNSAGFAPYSVGSTNLDDAAVYFGVASFGPNWLKEHQDLAWSNDETERKMYQKVLKAEENQLKAEEELTQLNEWIDKKIDKYYDDPDKLLSKIDWSDYPTLAAMDKSIGKEGAPATGDLLAMTRGLDYRYADLVSDIYSRCEQIGAKGNGDTFTSNVGAAASSGGKTTFDIWEEAARLLRNSQLWRGPDTNTGGDLWDNVVPLPDNSPSGEPQMENAIERVTEEDRQKMQELYDEVHGEGAFMRDMEAARKANDLGVTTEQEAEVNKEQDKVLREGADAVSGIATPAEQKVMNKAWSVTSGKVKTFWDTIRAGDGQLIKNIALANVTDVMNSHASETLGNFQTIYDYEMNQQNIQAMELERDALKAQLGDKMYAGREVVPEVGQYVTIDGQQYYVVLSNMMTGDGSYAIDQIARIDNGTPYNVGADVYAAVGNSEAVQKMIGEQNEEASKIQAANADGATYTEEEMAAAQRIRELELQIEDGQHNLQTGEDAYNQSLNAFDEAQRKREEKIHMLKVLGIDTSEFEREDEVVGYLVNFGEYEQTVWSQYNPSDAYRIALAEGEDRDVVLAQAKKGNDEVTAELEKARAAKAYIEETGLQVPQNYIDNLDRHIAKLERDQKDYEYFSLSQNKDFEEMVRKGRDEEYAQRPSGGLLGTAETGWTQDEYYAHMDSDNWDEMSVYANYGLRNLAGVFTNQMSKDEKDTYYYLMGKGDRQAAIDYVSSLTDMSFGVLHTRFTDEIKQQAEDLVGDGAAGFVGANILAILASPAAAMASLGYMGYNWITGSEINPDNAALLLNNFRTTTREQSAKEISDYYGEGSIRQKIVQGFYEMVSNRLDSIANGVAFGGLSSGIGNSMLSEFVGASPMGFSAAMDAMMDAKRKGASDGQAYGIGLVTFLAETGTEAVSLDNIKEAFAMGKEVTQEGLKSFMKNWLTKSGISEMLGESANDLIENYWDEKIMGELSDHNDRVWSYRMQGYGKEEADALARRDELQGVLHTALISYLSPGLDVVSYGAGRLNYYREKTRRAQQSGENVSIIDVARREIAEGREKIVDDNHEPGQIAGPEQVDEETVTQKQNVLPPDNVEQEGEVMQEEAPEQGPIQTVNAPEAGVSNVAEEQTVVTGDLEKDFQALESAMEADQSTQTATMASVLDAFGTDESSDMARAAAASLDELSGDDSVTMLQDLVLGAFEGGVDGGLVKQAIQNAALSENSAAYAVMQSSEYIHADLEEKARMLAETVDADRNNAAVMSEISKAVYEYRVAEAEKEAILNGGLKNSAAAQETANAAAQATQAAQEELESRQADLEAKGQNLQAATEEFQQNPGDHAKADMVNHALSDLNKSSEVEQEYQQHLDNVQKQQKKAEADAQRATQEDMAVVRQQAQQTVAEQDQQREEARAQAEEAQRIQNEQTAQAEADQQAADNATVADAESYIEQYHPDATEEEKQKIREVFAKIRNEQPATSTVRDQNGQLSPEARQNRDKFVRRIANKFGVSIEITDTTHGGVVDRQNGYVDLRNNRIVLDETASTDDAMFFVLGHELTHIAEQSGTYNQLAQSLIRMRYGTDEGRLAADIRARKNLYDYRLARMHEQDNSIDATPLTEEQAGQEIVADIMGDLLRGDQNLVDRLVAEEPSVARRILDSIKSFIKKAVGMKGAWLSDAQRTVDMLETALQEATGKKNAEAELKQKFLIQDASPYLIDQIRNASETLSKMAPVKSVSSKVDLSPYSEIGHDRKAQVKLWAKDKADSLGRKMYREGFGEAELSNSAIKTIFSYLGYTNDAAIAAFEAIPDVYKNGTEIETHEDHKSRAVESHTFAAPIEIDGERGDMGLIVRKSRNGTNFKTYKIVLPDGREFVIRNDKTELAHQAGSEEATRTDSVSDMRVAQEYSPVKPLVQNDQGESLAEELPGGTVAVNTQQKFSLSSFDENEQQRVRNALIKSGRFTTEEVDKYLNDALGIASIIAADRDRLDFTADPTKTMLKPNAEYVKTLDASTLCAKRLLYQGTFDAIQHLLPNTPLMPEDLIDLSNMMREMGYETPCGICYVESRRRHLGKFADEWLKSYNGDYIPTLDQVTTSDGLEELRNTHPQTYTDFINAMNKKGTMNPKVVQLRTDYRGEISEMTPGQIQKVKDIGGLRVQSFSDFEVPHLLDMAQAVMDMAAKNLTAQAYTKVPNFPWAFGDTGIKINLSLIGKGTGLDENGNLLFDDVEGMPFDEAMRLRDRYSKNVGTILVGINDDHILAAMADPRIDFIIPFHKSGWSEQELSRMPVLNSYSDYTNSQNEKVIVGRTKDGGYKTESLEKSKRVNFQPVGENGYWDFSKTGKENAEEYLRMCAEDRRLPKFSQFLVDNGDGSFSLQPDGSTDGYWKTLIDFKMYDNEGNGSPQTAVTPDINMVEAQRILNEYSLDRNGIRRESNNSLPVAQPVVDRYVEEFKAKHPLDENRVKYSLPSDAPYLAAVERGEMEEAQMMVDETANQALINSKVRDEDGNLLPVYHGTSEQFTVFDMSKGRSTMDIQGSFFSPYDIEAGGYGENVGRYYLNITNPAPEKIAYAALNRYKGQNEAGRKAREDLISQGYDGVENYDEYIAFYPEQIKSADPVTYDDDGNVIPLSERFKSEQQDIRYSLPSDNLLEQQIRNYLASGGSLSTNVTPPGSNLPGTPGMRPQRQFGSRTAQTSDALHDEVKEYLYSHSSYTPDNNQAQIDRAVDWVRSMASERDTDGYYAALNEVTSDNFDYRSADGQARMLTVMSMAALKAENGDRNALNDELRLADAYNKQGTDLGRMLQARKIFRLMTPLGRASVLENMQDKVNEELGRRGSSNRVALPQEILDEAANAKTEEDFARAHRKAAKALASQIPSNWRDKFRGWRMLSMLGNPRTHIRNIVGNALFVPVVSLKNKLGAVGEIATRQKQRTKTLTPVLSKQIKEFALQDANALKDTLTGEAKYNENNAVEREQKPFKGLLQALIDFNSGRLEAEDWHFLRNHYKRALGGWMQANGYTAEQLKSNPALLEQGRAYAIQEAQKATYRDFSKFASQLNKISREGGVAGFVVDAVLPFKKTPANILKRGMEYSPAGIMRSLTTDLYHLKQWNDYQNKKLAVLPDKAISPTQFIDRICSGLSGTMILVAGALLGSAGLVTCGLDDDEDKLEKEKGNQEYSFKFSIAGHDFTYTIDWAAPMSMPFFVGAAIQEQLASQEGFDIQALVNAFGNITEPVFNLSMLDGVNTLFKTSQYDDTNTLTQIGAKVASNYATSYWPSLFGAATRTFFDDTRRKAFVKQGEGTGVLGTFRYAKEQTENKIPGLSRTNIPYRNVWGEAETSSFVERLFENFISPGYITEYGNDPILNEMARLYDATGDSAMIPEDPPKSVTHKKQKHVFTDKEWDRYKEVRGQTLLSSLTELMNNADYQDADDATQVQMIKGIWSYADQVGKSAVIPNYEMKDRGDNPVAEVAKGSKVTSYKTNMITSLSAGDYEGYDAMVEALREEGVADTEIKDKIADFYRDQYKSAYRKKDRVKMAEIEDILDHTDFSFNIDGEGGWEEQVDKEND